LEELTTIENSDIWMQNLSQPEKTSVIWDTLIYRPNNRKVKIGPGSIFHHHFLYIDHGEFNLTIEGKQHHLSQGDLLWLSPYVTRTVESINDVNTDNFRFHFDIKLNNKQCKMKDPFFIVSDCRDMLPIFQRLFELERHPGKYRNLATRGILLDLFSRIFDRIDKKTTETSNTRKFTSTQCRIIDTYIINNINKELNAQILAKQLKLSATYFSFLFKNTYGIAPRTHIKKERVLMTAQQLAQLDLNINEIAREFGYRNPFLYSRQFREIMHCSPREYRQRFR
jgi:AraC-like DNA-binding protein